LKFGSVLIHYDDVEFAGVVADMLRKKKIAPSSDEWAPCVGDHIEMVRLLGSE
jgi:hypothetical protein